MTKNGESKNAVDAGVPKSDAMRRLSESKKRALDLKEYAEHESGIKRKRLQDQATQAAKHEKT
jgi:hypothetical protein